MTALAPLRTEPRLREVAQSQLAADDRAHRSRVDGPVLPC
jgi:hypothetical protein